jgi:hypothetical protein
MKVKVCGMEVENPEIVNVIENISNLLVSNVVKEVEKIEEKVEDTKQEIKEDVKNVVNKITAKNNAPITLQLLEHNENLNNFLGSSVSFSNLQWAILYLNRENLVYRLGLLTILNKEIFSSLCWNCSAIHVVESILSGLVDLKKEIDVGCNISVKIVPGTKKDDKNIYFSQPVLSMLKLVQNILRQEQAAVGDPEVQKSYNNGTYSFKVAKRILDFIYVTRSSFILQLPFMYERATSKVFEPFYAYKNLENTCLQFDKLEKEINKNFNSSLVVTDHNRGTSVSNCNFAGLILSWISTLHFVNLLNLDHFCLSFKKYPHFRLMSYLTQLRAIVEKEIKEKNKELKYEFNYEYTLDCLIEEKFDLECNWSQAIDTTEWKKYLIDPNYHEEWEGIFDSNQFQTVFSEMKDFASCYDDEILPLKKEMPFLLNNLDDEKNRVKINKFWFDVFIWLQKSPDTRNYPLFQITCFSERFPTFTNLGLYGQFHIDILTVKDCNCSKHNTFEEFAKEYKKCIVPSGFSSIFSELIKVFNRERVSEWLPYLKIAVDRYSAERLYTDYKINTDKVIGDLSKSDMIDNIGYSMDFCKNECPAPHLIQDLIVNEKK